MSVSMARLLIWCAAAMIAAVVSPATAARRALWLHGGDRGEVFGDKSVGSGGDKSGTTPPRQNERAPQPTMNPRVAEDVSFAAERGRY